MIQVYEITRPLFTYFGTNTAIFARSVSSAFRKADRPRTLQRRSGPPAVADPYPVIRKLYKSRPYKAPIGRCVTLADFFAWPHALISILGGRRGVVFDALAKLGVERRICLWISYLATATIAASDMILTLPTPSAKALAQPDALSKFVPPFHTATFDYRLFRHDRGDADLAHRWIRDVIAGLT